YQHGYGIPFTF
nr:immunoglobulin light chain junction region [Macaca mulatta]